MWWQYRLSHTTNQRPKLSAPKSFHLKGVMFLTNEELELIMADEEGTIGPLVALLRTDGGATGHIRPGVHDRIGNKLPGKLLGEDCRQLGKVLTSLSRKGRLHSWQKAGRQHYQLIDGGNGDTPPEAAAPNDEPTAEDLAKVEAEFGDIAVPESDRPLRGLSDDELKERVPEGVLARYGELSQSEDRLELRLEIVRDEIGELLAKQSEAVSSALCELGERGREALSEEKGWEQQRRGLFTKGKANGE